jgi:hypothetical protein
VVVLCRVEGANQLSRHFLDEPPHFEALEGVGGDELGAGGECLGDVPRDEVALSEGLVSVDENGDLAICIGITSECIGVGLFKPGLFVGA